MWTETGLGLKGEDMAYLTDKEKRLLFSALSREKEIHMV